MEASLNEQISREVEEEQDFGDLWLIPSHDAWIKVCSYLDIRTIADTRLVSKFWYENGREQVTLYKIGFDKNGWSKWSDDKEKTYGWAMKISVDKNGNVSGANTNNGDHVTTAKKKTYTGKRVGKIFYIHVKFDETGQENEYVGSFTKENEKSIFKGSFKLIAGNSRREIGSGGEMAGFAQSI